MSPKPNKITGANAGGLSRLPVRTPGGKGCLYIKSLKKVDPKVLKELIGESVRAVS